MRSSQYILHSQTLERNTIMKSLAFNACNPQNSPWAPDHMHSGTTHTHTHSVPHAGTRKKFAHVLPEGIIYRKILSETLHRIQPDSGLNNLQRVSSSSVWLNGKLEGQGESTLVRWLLDQQWCTVPRHGQWKSTSGNEDVKMDEWSHQAGQNEDWKSERDDEGGRNIQENAGT